MRVYVPEHYKKFRCKENLCKDNCCIGWDIMIDQDSLQEYHKVTGPFGEALRNGILCSDEGAVFRKDSSGRCVFLNQKNLCEIYRTLGETALCQICAQHPRFHNQYGSIVQSGLGLACEQAVDLILQNHRPFRLVEVSGDFEESREDDWANWLFMAQEWLFQILRNRSLPIEKRIHRILDFTFALQQQINQDQELPRDVSMVKIQEFHFLESFHMAESLKRWIYFYHDLDCMNPSWKEILSEIAQESTISVSEPGNALYYENLAGYFIYRYFMSAYEDYNLFDKVRFAVLSCLLIETIYQFCRDKKKSFTYFDIVRIYSKEIEYSDENLSAVLEEFLFDSPCGSVS